MFQPKPGFHPRDAWFRSADWGEDAKAEFERRLARAQPGNRVQYRRVKALALLGSGDREKVEAGRGMFLSIIREADAPRHEIVSALCLLGAHEHDAGRLTEAEDLLRQALALIATGASGSTGLEEVRLAEILLTHGGAADLAEAHDLLERRAGKLPVFVASRFRLALVATRVALARGRGDLAADWARAALIEADATYSGLANHPRLLLAEVDKATRRWLESVVAGKQRHDIRRR